MRRRGRGRPPALRPGGEPGARRRGGARRGVARGLAGSRGGARRGTRSPDALGRALLAARRPHARRGEPVLATGAIRELRGSAHPAAAARAPATDGRARLGLVEEALLDQPRPLLRTHLDVARREQEHLVGDPLHAAVERVRQAGGEVDQALREVRVAALEVEDHRCRVLELVGDLLGVVEALRHHEMYLHARAAVLDRAQHSGGPRRAARRVVGEDVVDLVAAAARLEPAHVRPFAVAVLQLALGLGRLGLVVAIAVVGLGEAEIDERLVPGVSESHGVPAVSAVLPKSLSFTSYILVSSENASPEPFEVERDGVVIAGETVGEGPDVVLLHGLTATRRYVVMGSKALPRAGYRVTTFDARGHGESSPARDAAEYEYRDLVADLGAVLDQLGAERAAIGGASMGAHTAMAFTLAFPERGAALVQVTPAYDGRPRDLGEWDRLSDGLRRGGVDGFLAAWEFGGDPKWRDTATTVARQRLERHRHPEAVADALHVVPRSIAFEGLEELEAVTTPTVVVASRDDADPGHPYAIGKAYADRLPHARLVSEEPGASPLAWQGARLSKAIASFLGEAGWGG